MTIANRAQGGIRMKDAVRAIIFITASAFGITAPGVSAANDEAKNPVFQSLDANRDGFISRKEAQRDPAVEAVYEQVDTDNLAQK